MTTFSTVHSIERDGKDGPPIVIPPGGGKKVTYFRTTTWIDVLEDRYLLERWQERQVILGLIERTDLMLSAAAHRDDRDKLNDIAKEAKEAAKARAAANVGTAVHKLTELYDRGGSIGTIPGDYRRDLDAYIAATAPFNNLAIEEFLVNDDLKVGGTPDRVVEYGGVNYIADIKTGSVDFGVQKMGMQLAVYAHSQRYDPATGDRGDLTVDQRNAIIIHLPAGTGTCQPLWINIAAGWEDVQLARQVRESRKRRGLTAPLNVLTRTA